MVGLVGKLAVYDGPLTSKNAAFLRPSDPGSSMEELRKRYHEDGYLFLKHLLSREDVLEARKQYFEFMASTGVLKESTAPVEGVFNPERSPEDFPGLGSGTHGKGDKADEFINSAVEAHYQKWYTEVFCQSPILYDFIAKFTGWGQHTLALKRSLLRNNIPNTTPIGVHYDQIFLRYGDPTSVTAWVPIGDISIQGGGLMYLEDGMSPLTFSG
jgi:phytanoyl-CoA hydroxylase